MRTVGSCMYTACVHDCARARCRYTKRKARLLHIKLQREPRHEWQRLTKGFPNFRQRGRREESTRAPLFAPPQMYGSHAGETQQSDKTLGFDSRGRAEPRTFPCTQPACFKDLRWAVASHFLAVLSTSSSKKRSLTPVGVVLHSKAPRNKKALTDKSN